MGDPSREVGESLGFRPVMDGRFMARDGSARQPGATHCNKKICLAATDLSTELQILTYHQHLQNEARESSGS